MNNSQQITPRIIFFITLICLITCNFSQNILAQDNIKKNVDTKSSKSSKSSKSLSSSDIKLKEAINKVLMDQVADWNKGSLEGFMAGYWESPELSFYSGKNTTKGWQQTLDRYRLRYQSEGKEMGTLVFKDLEIELLGKENAFVRGKWQLDLKSETVGGLFTLVLKKFPSGWRVIHDHTS